MVDDPPVQPPTVHTPGREPSVIPSQELFRGQRQVFIEHAGQLYRLSITRSGKLILQK